MGGEILAVTGSQSPALLSSARRSVLDRATAPQSSALRNPDTRWGSHGDLRPLMGAEVVTPEEPHPTDFHGDTGRGLEEGPQSAEADAPLPRERSGECPAGHGDQRWPQDGRGRPAAGGG